MCSPIRFTRPGAQTRRERGASDVRGAMSLEISRKSRSFAHLRRSQGRSFLPLPSPPEAARRCHPERARGTRASEGSAYAQGCNRGCLMARNARERRICLRPGVQPRLSDGAERARAKDLVTPGVQPRLSDGAERARAKDLVTPGLQLRLSDGAERVRAKDLVTPGLQLRLSDGAERARAKDLLFPPSARCDRKAGPSRLRRSG